jgi:hypothetical protein
MLPTDALVINEIQSQKLFGKSLRNSEVRCHIHEIPLVGFPELRELSLHIHINFLKVRLNVIFL